MRSRFAGMLGILLLCSMIIQYVGAQEYAKIAADRSFDRLLAGSANSIAGALSVVDGTLQLDLPYSALDILSNAPDDRVFYRVTGPNTRLVAGYQDLPVAAGLMRTVIKGDDDIRYFTAPYRGEPVRFALLGRQVAEPGVRGWVWIQVGQTRKARAAFQRELMVLAITPIAIMTLAALAIVWFGIARALRPLVKMGAELAVRDPSDFDQVDTQLPRELTPLANAMNGYIQRLGKNVEVLRTFVAEAAHQMRTPLAALRAQAQVGADGDAEEARASLHAVERNAAKLSRFLDQLLSDAVVTHRSDVAIVEQFDLIDVVREAVHETGSLGGRLTVDDRIGPAPFAGDFILIREAIKNLIDNAIHHGEGQIEIWMDSDETNYVISIADRGPGLGTQAQSDLFERFARGPTKASGAGLGLAIVKRAIEAHAGQVILEDRPGGGLIAKITLPVRAK